VYVPVGIFYQQPELPAKIRSLHSLDILFTLDDVHEQLEAYIVNWVNKADRLEPVYDLYFSVLYSQHMYLHSVFLSLAQAIETYHRRTIGGKYQSNAEYQAGLYKKFVEAIPPELDDDFKMSLIMGSLRYANQFSLRKRLRDITGRLAENLPIRFIALESRSEFIERVCKIRNHLTHYDPDEQIDIEGTELHDLTEKLMVLLEVCLLEELGFGFDAIRAMTSKHRRYKRMFQRW